MLEAVFFAIIALTLTIYVVLDGFDLGAGALHLFVSKSEEEREEVLEAIGPVWDGNEVWLIVAGGMLICAFPALYAASFSGFYLPLMIVLWLLMGRGLGIELRHHVDNPLWKQACDVVFALSSGLLALFFGAALGNIVRGVPLDASGTFFEPLWGDFEPRALESGRTGVLDWYTLLVGVHALAALAMHGALWLAHKTQGDLAARALAWSRRIWWGAVALTALTTMATWVVQPHVAGRMASAPEGYLFVVIAVVGLVGARMMRTPGWKFLSSCGYLAGMIASCAFALYPYVLPSSIAPSLGLTVQNAAAAPYSLKVALAWWIPGMVLAGAYTFVVYRMFKAKAG